MSEHADVTWRWVSADGETRVEATSEEGRAKALAEGVPFMTQRHGPLREIEVHYNNGDLVRALLRQIAERNALLEDGRALVQTAFRESAGGMTALHWHDHRRAWLARLDTIVVKKEAE